MRQSRGFTQWDAIANWIFIIIFYYEAIISEVAGWTYEIRHNEIFKEMRNWAIYENFVYSAYLVICNSIKPH